MIVVLGYINVIDLISSVSNNMSNIDIINGAMVPNVSKSICAINERISMISTFLKFPL